MNWWSSGRFRITAAALCLAAGACAGGGDDGDGGGATGADAGGGLSCESSGGDGESFELRLGLRSGENQEYVELEDGDRAPVVLGYQGLYMLLLESEAALSVEGDELCLRCAAEMNPSGSASLERASQGANVAFQATGSGVFRGSLTLVIGSGTDRPNLEGAEVTLTMSCSGHGLSGSVERAVRLMPE